MNANRLWEAVMEIVSRCRIVALAAVVCSALLVATCLAQAQRKPDAPASPAEESLRRFLQTFDDDKTTRYIAGFRDLNADGTPEAIVYLMGKWCGSGGCKTLILTRDGRFWKNLPARKITRPPISFLSTTPNARPPPLPSLHGAGNPPTDHPPPP